MPTSNEMRREMKTEDIQRAVKEVVLDVFENMYFMFPEVIRKDDPAPCDELRVRARITGSMNSWS